MSSVWGTSNLFSYLQRLRKTECRFSEHPDSKKVLNSHEKIIKKIKFMMNICNETWIVWFLNLILRTSRGHSSWFQYFHSLIAKTCTKFSNSRVKFSRDFGIWNICNRGFSISWLEKINYWINFIIFVLRMKNSSFEKLLGRLIFKKSEKIKTEKEIRSTTCFRQWLMINSLMVE